MPAEIAIINPRHKRKSRKTHSRRRRAHARRRTHARRRKSLMIVRRVNPRRRHRVHARRRRHASRRRNPRFSMGGITHALIPAAIGGAGAVAVDIGVGYLGQSLPIPDFLKTGYGKVALQVVAAFGMGWLAGKAIGQEKGRAVTAGALTVAAYGLIKNLVKSAAPTVPGLAGDYEAMRMGAYMPPSLGYTSAAPSLQGMGAYIQQPGELGGFDGMSDGM